MGFLAFFTSKYGFLLWVFSKNMGDYGFFAQIWERFKIIWDVAGLPRTKSKSGSSVSIVMSFFQY
jgi:hypothetical protein